ncbi:hypothetical protein HKBW3S44_00966 [Candidatus Hakubella thermalkaliphila]|uniref:Uncharacterized protein n=1 Tax=Candidatus Hakubella thermalkaliphila TaxID=2754717 RepID=A0A6V8Q1M0_9ACTN|nr:hypothetical protein HKBW3S44_00966 [Candidatus Hakubella thermalkaliphila]
MFNCQVNPSFHQFFELLVGGNLLFDFIDEFRPDVLGSAFHLMGIAELVVRAYLFFGVSCIAD